MEDEDEKPPPQEIDFCTLGMFIIDEIHFLPPTPPVYDIPGGAGTYSALGARLFSAPPLTRTVSWIVSTGSDFPASLHPIIDSWSTTAEIQHDPSRLTTRGWNGYTPSGIREFKYTTPKLRLEQSHLTNDLLFSKSFHIICSPARCINLTTSILRARKRLSPTAQKPLIIWEPVPDLCTPEELLNTTNALPYVDICSPNHSELLSLMGDNSSLPPTDPSVTIAVERACEQLLSSMPLQSYALVVRSGEKGCYIAKNGGRKPPSKKRKRPANHTRGGLTLDMDMESLFAGLATNDDGTLAREEEAELDPGVELWLPAYFGKDEQEKVVDPTGGGNAFLGGLAVALARGKSIEEASTWGSVAASFAIEQVGMPVLGVDEATGRETWNGDFVEGRLEEFLKRVGR